MSYIALFPCPFCGKTARAGHIQQYPPPRLNPALETLDEAKAKLENPPDRLFWRAWCDNTRDCKVLPRVEAPTIRELQIAWNRRDAVANMRADNVPAPRYAETME